MQFDRVLFDKYEADIPFMTEKDKKDILRGLEYGVNMVIASMVKTCEPQACILLCFTTL